MVQCIIILKFEHYYYAQGAVYVLPQANLRVRMEELMEGKHEIVGRWAKHIISACWLTVHTCFRHTFTFITFAATKTTVDNVTFKEKASKEKKRREERERGKNRLGWVSGTVCLIINSVSFPKTLLHFQGVRGKSAVVKVKRAVQVCARCLMRRFHRENMLSAILPWRDFPIIRPTLKVNHSRTALKLKKKL